MTKRVLIITYYWPPSAGSGVQRWLKFAKYLPEFGWEPVIFTPENPDFDLRDKSLEKEVDPATEVLRFPIWEPYGIFRKLKRGNVKDTAKILGESNKSWIDRMGIWIRANLIVPDPRVFWVKPSVNFLADLIQKGQFDAVITTGPPHSMHLIGRNLKRKTGIIWLADFRDPWSEWEFLDTLPMHPIVRKKHRKLEKSIFQEADKVIAISPTFQQEFQKLAQRQISLLTNGFDSSDLPEGWQSESTVRDQLEIVYTGVIDSIRNPIPFLKAFQEVYSDADQAVRLRFVGKVSEDVQSYIIQNSWLKEHVTLEGYVSHGEVFDFYKDAHLLLLILTDTKNAKGNIPGKLFEYLATGRPILALGDPLGDSAGILKSAGAGHVFSHTDLKGIGEFLLKFVPGSSTTTKSTLEAFSRKKLTEKLAGILDEKTNTVS